MNTFFVLVKDQQPLYSGVEKRLEEFSFFQLFFFDFRLKLFLQSDISSDAYRAYKHSVTVVKRSFVHIEIYIFALDLSMLFKMHRCKMFDNYLVRILAHLSHRIPSGIVRV